MGYSWPGVFPLGASERTERFFTQLLFHDLIQLACNLVLWSCMLLGLYIAFL